MKMLNFASLDPKIVDTGRHGLGNAATADRAIWQEFHNDWEKAALEAQMWLKAQDIVPPSAVADSGVVDHTGETKTSTVEVRLKQDFFRQAVISSYKGRCCMTGLADQRLLIASHIVPWSKDKVNRLNPSNGLCLSALHDKAFDRGLITVLPDWRVRVSKDLLAAKDEFCDSAINSLDGKKIELPEKFQPLTEFLQYHNKNVFENWVR
ncbi:MAG: HNH endonuclease [Elusimicrobiota bacterium]